MPISVQCSGCAKRFKAPDQAAGKKVACPVCKTPLEIPRPEPAAEEDDYRLAPSDEGPRGFLGGTGSPPAPVPAAPKHPPAPAKTAAAAPPARWANEPPAAGSSPAAALGGLLSSSAKPGIAPRTASSTPAWLRHLHWALALALLPLCFSIVLPGETEEEFAERLRESFEAVQPQGDPAGDASQTDESNPDESDGMTRDDLLNTLPGHKLKGALLAYDSKMHWLFALLSVGFFLTFVLLLATDGSAKVLHLLGLGLFTATFGVGVLLVIQGLASFSAGGIRIRGGGVIALIYLVLMAIGWMYYLALSSDVGFVGSAIGFTFGVGLCEEVCKALPILAYYRMGEHKQSWRGAFLWGLASGVGFGVSEGMMYSADHYNGIAGSGIYFVRFLSCVALHAVWAGSVGISINQRQHLIDEGDSDDLASMALGVLRMIAIPMVLHGLYDAFLKQDIPLLALLTAAASFGYLAWQVSNLRGEDDQDERAAYVASYIRAKTAAE